MNDNSNDKETNQQDAKQDARIGYQAAIQAWINENRQNWDKTRIMFLFNSLLLAGVLQCLLKGEKYVYIPPIFLCPIGIVMCVIWYHIVKRGMEYNDYWIKSAREIEGLYFSDSVQTFTRGALFSLGDIVILNLDGSPCSLQIKTKLSVKRSIYILIDIIGFLYIIGALISGYNIGGILGIITIFGGIAVTLCLYIRWEASIQKYFSKLLKREENLSTILIKFLRKKLQ